jgi:nucleoside-diphosphate-sugar epimerase
MKRILVTGGSGRVGRYVIEHLLDQQYEVVNVDVKPPDRPPTDWLCLFRACDMSDYGQTFAALYGFDAVVHLAADPRPDSDHFSGAQRFHNNTLATYNVFNAAVALGMERVVWASSETVYGYPFDAVIPDYAPMDEQHRYSPQSSYALSKLVGETMAAQFSRLSGIPFIGLQLSNVVVPSVYEQFPTFWSDPQLRIFDLWSYVDCRDAAQAVGLSLSANSSSSDVFIIAAEDTVMNQPSAELMAEYFPSTRLADNLGTYQSLMSSEKARKVLGYQPQHSWRAYVPTKSGASS